MIKYKRMTKTKRLTKSKNRKNKKNIKYISKKVMKGGSICKLFDDKSSNVSASGNDSAPGLSKKGASGNDKKELPDFNINLPKGAGFDTSNIADYINFIKQHQKNRFAELDYILEHNSNVNVIIAHDNIIDKNYIHSLGTGLAIGQWEIWEKYQEKKLGLKLQTKFSTTNIENLTTLVNELYKKYKSRISFGKIGYKESKPPSKTVIHVWGANEKNWNLQNDVIIPGAGQAKAFKKQTVGVFGIATIYHGPDLFSEPLQVEPNTIKQLFQSTTDKLQEYL